MESSLPYRTAPMDPDFRKVVRFMAGFYRITAPLAFANVKKERNGEFKNKWCVDIRNNNGDIIQYAGVWNTKRDATEEAIRILGRNYV